VIPLSVHGSSISLPPRTPWFQHQRPGDGFYHYHRSWNDDLSCPRRPDHYFRVKAGEPQAGAAAFESSGAAPQLIQDFGAARLGAGARSLRSMIALAHRVFRATRGAQFYCDHWYTNLFLQQDPGFRIAARGPHGFFRAKRTCSSSPTTCRAAIIDLNDRLVERLPAPRSASTSTGRQSVAKRRCGYRAVGRARATRPRSSGHDVIDIRRSSMLWGITLESLRRWLRAAAMRIIRELAVRRLERRSSRSACVVKSVARSRACATVTSLVCVPDHQPDLGADLPEDRPPPCRHRWLDDPPPSWRR